MRAVANSGDKITKRKAFALRIDEGILTAMQRYADDDLRSLNAQIEYVLRQALREQGRLPTTKNGEVVPKKKSPRSV